MRHPARISPELNTHEDFVSRVKLSFDREAEKMNPCHLTVQAGDPHGRRELDISIAPRPRDPAMRWFSSAHLTTSAEAISSSVVARPARNLGMPVETSL
jgi:hypothetical protein